MNAVAETPRRSLIADMAARYGMEADAFELTVRETCSPKGRDSKPLTKAEFAAFLLVAKEYGLNPLTKEIYAFPAKGGGIVPVLSIDGWVSLVNSHNQCDGFEFEMEHDDKGNLVACTCHMYRKDRSRPVSVTEYLSECKRPTEPWKMEHRMLRHKAMIQAARYAFGFSGIYDEDEAEKIAMKDVTPSAGGKQPPQPPKPPVNEREVDMDDGKTIDHVAEAEDMQEEREAEEGQANETAQEEVDADAETGEVQVFDPDAFLDNLQRILSDQTTAEGVEEAWDELDVEATLTTDSERLEVANSFKATALKKVK